MSRMTFTQNDFSGEKTVTTVAIGDIDAANFDTEVAKVVALETAIGDITIGAKYRREITLESPGLTAFPSDSEAQRELKWLVSYHDNGNVQRKLNTEIGCADVIDGTLLIENSDLADLTHADWIAFVTAFENAVKAPWSGNAVTVERITLVGRRS